MSPREGQTISTSHATPHSHVCVSEVLFQTRVTERYGALFLSPVLLVKKKKIYPGHRSPGRESQSPQPSLVVGKRHPARRGKPQRLEGFAPTQGSTKEAQGVEVCLSKVGHCPYCQLWSSGADLLLKKRGRS